jgi:hypothetical protein
LSGTPSFALTAKAKMAICKFGADDQQLQGPPRKNFLQRCMANKDDPRGPAVGAPPVAGGMPPPPPPLPPPQH